MKYCTVTSYMSRGPGVLSDNLLCAERRLIRSLYIKCIKSGKKPHQFTDWLHRKYGQLVVERKNTLGDAISLPCVLCRKTLSKHGIKWTAHDGYKWVHSNDNICVPIPTRSTNKQKRMLGFKY